MTFKNLTDIIDFAIEKEKEAAEFYMSVSGQEHFSGGISGGHDPGRGRHRASQPASGPGV